MLALASSAFVCASDLKVRFITGGLYQKQLFYIHNWKCRQETFNVEICTELLNCKEGVTFQFIFYVLSYFPMIKEKKKSKTELSILELRENVSFQIKRVLFSFFK